MGPSEEYLWINKEPSSLQLSRSHGTEKTSILQFVQKRRFMKRSRSQRKDPTQTLDNLTSGTESLTTQGSSETSALSIQVHQHIIQPTNQVSWRPELPRILPTRASQRKSLKSIHLSSLAKEAIARDTVSSQSELHNVLLQTPKRPYSYQRGGRHSIESSDRLNLEPFHKSAKATLLHSPSFEQITASF